MNIREMVEQLFGVKNTPSTIVDRWKTYTAPTGFVTTQKIKALTDKFRVFGRDNKGNQLIVTADTYVLITYPPYDKRRDPIKISVREDNLRPAIINDMTEETDLEGNLSAPKIRYGYIWRSQLASDRSDLLTEMHAQAANGFQEYQADQKSWVLIETTMLNKTDTVPQLRVTFKPYEMANTEEGVFMMFSGGFIAIDSLNFVTIALDYEVAAGAVDVISNATLDDRAAILKLFEILRQPITPVESNYMAFNEVTFETSLLSALANNV